MQKPRNFEDTKEFNGGGFEQLDPGNYVCTVKLVEETVSKTNKPMLKIYLDIAQGESAGFFAKKFKEDDREQKKWPCIVYQLTEDKDSNCSRGLKSFIGAVAASNPNFDVNAIWGPNFAKWFRDKRVGASFRREEYVGNDGESRWSVKAYRFFSADKVDEMSMPKDKPLPEPSYSGPGEWGSVPSSSDMFPSYAESEGQLPF